MKSEKRETKEEIELPNRKELEHFESWKITRTYEYWKLISSNKQQ